jgi:SAM-dependent methyltransferase
MCTRVHDPASSTPFEEGGNMAIEASPRIEIPTTHIPRGKSEWELFTISFVILFLELACIRWLSSTVIFLTFFTNIVLMACFLGMSVGCLAASRKQDFINWVIPLSLWTIVLAFGTLAFYKLYGRVLIDVGGQGSPQQVFFGTEYNAKDPSYLVVPIEVVASLFFALTALVFVGLGQIMGRAFNRVSNPVLAYSINILGSLAGILAFGAASYLCTSPVTWFLIGIGPCFYFVDRSRVLRFCQFLTLLAIVALLSGYGIYTGNFRISWSPYYKIDYDTKTGGIVTNNIGHQQMVSIREAAPAYLLPHLLNRDAGGMPLEDVLIIGAGSGNDVQAALTQGARHIDAVEIDPVLYELGRRDHPDRPYDDRRVSIQIDDGRSFVRKTGRAYDLVSYAVVDSLVLHSGYSSLRLESFLFTEQAFRDIKQKLKPNGVFAMYNFYRQGWVIGRLAKMAEEVFGTKPLVLSLPYQSEITPERSQGGHLTLLLIGRSPSSRLDLILAKFKRDGFFWANEKPKWNEAVNAFGSSPPEVSGAQSKDWQKIGLAEVDTSRIKWLPTDDWPFLYLREPTIPALNLRWMFLVIILSLALLSLFVPLRSSRPNGQMFFLGAGFMLLETKGVVQMALLFGSTWLVNSIIFFAILVMILLSNLFVLWFRPRTRWMLYYNLLIICLLLNFMVPMDSYLGLSGVSRAVLACTLVFAPVFFAGIIFALAFRYSRRPDVDLGSNIAGVILGGVSENLSLAMGFNSLLLLAILFYMLSALPAPRTSTVAAPSSV